RTVKVQLGKRKKKRGHEKPTLPYNSYIHLPNNLITPAGEKASPWENVPFNILEKGHERPYKAGRAEPARASGLGEGRARLEVPGTSRSRPPHTSLPDPAGPQAPRNRTPCSHLQWAALASAPTQRREDVAPFRPERSFGSRRVG
ncbi:hypothetical protein DBR06_SOUSAS33310010, partial [Sousa chinensis]